MKKYRIKYRILYQIDKYRCYEVFDEIICYDIFIDNHLIYAKLNKFSIKSFALEVILELEYLGISEEKYK